jgi:hypothetical protein
MNWPELSEYAYYIDNVNLETISAFVSKFSHLADPTTGVVNRVEDWVPNRQGDGDIRVKPAMSFLFAALTMAAFGQLAFGGVCELKLEKGTSATNIGQDNNFVQLAADLGALHIMVTQLCKRAIDLFQPENPLTPHLRAALAILLHRGYTWEESTKLEELIFYRNKLARIFLINYLFPQGACDDSTSRTQASVCSAPDATAC